MDPGATYAHRSFFTPETCSTHTLCLSLGRKLTGNQARSFTRVSIDSVDFDAGSNQLTQTANITDRLGRGLLDLLNTALQDFQHGQTHSGNTALSAYGSRWP
jgi:hypothetical protein